MDLDRKFGIIRVRPKVVMRSRLALLLIFAFPLMCWSTMDPVFSDKEADHFTQLALENFWGKAIDETGKPLQPKDDKERKALPIPRSDALRIAHAGVPAGLAVWAGLEWKPYYLAFMQKERRSGRWSQKQIAFIGVLFGVAQGSTEKAFSEHQCDEKHRTWAKQILAEAEKSL